MCFATLAAGATAALTANAGAIGAVGAGISAGGSILGGLATANAASYQAQVARNNAQIAQQNAVYSLEAGNAKSQLAGLQGAEQVGEVKTAEAANNVDVNTGSALDTQVGERQKSALSQYTIANNAQLQAYGYRAAATGFQSQAALDEATAAEAPLGADIGAAGTLLENASAIGFKGLNITGSGGANPYTASTSSTNTVVGP